MLMAGSAPDRGCFPGFFSVRRFGVIVVLRSLYRSAPELYPFYGAAWSHASAARPRMSIPARL